MSCRITYDIPLVDEGIEKKFALGVRDFVGLEV